MKKINYLTKSINWKLWLGLLISALFLFLAFREVDLARTWAVIRSANLFHLSLAVMITFFHFVIRAWRWGILLEPIKKTGYLNRLSSIFIGFAANCLLPARLGEFIRANYLGNQENISGSSAFGTVVVERLFDGFTLLLILLIGLIYTTFPEKWQSVSSSLRGAGYLMLLFYIFLIIFLVGFKYKARLFLTLFDRILFFLPQNPRSKMIDISWNFSLGLVLTKNPYRLAQAIFYSLILWFLSLCQIQLVENAIGITLPFIATFLILAVTQFGVAIPSAPGYIGTFHLAVQYGFLFYGVGREEALSAAIIWHAAFFFPTILFGLISFLLLHISLEKLSEDPNILKKAPISDS